MKYTSIKLVLLLSFIFYAVSCLKPEGTPSEPDTILVFGIDAASWKVIDPLCKRGYLPTFSRLVNSGIKADLHTLEPTVSVMLWTTIATGMLPEHHGISSWLTEGTDTSGQLAITSNRRKVPALWNLFSQSKCFFTNWWATWPVENISGVMISNRAHFNNLDRVVFPPELKKTVCQTHRQSQETINSELSSLNPFGNQIETDDFLFKQLRKDRFYLDSAYQIASTEKFKMIALFVRGIDILEHEYLYDVLEYKNAPQIEKNRKGIVIAYYRYLDSQLERFIRICGKSCTIVVISDHGMDPIDKRPPIIEGLQLDNLLAKLNYEPVDPNGEPMPDKAIFRDNKKYPPGLKRGISANAHQFNSTPEMIQAAEDLKNNLQTIQINNVSLFSAIKINDDPAEILTLNIDPNGKPNDEIIINQNAEPLMQYVRFIIHPRAGQHWYSPNGIFLMSGPGIESSSDLNEINILDVAPTLAVLADLPVLKNLDGKPKLEFFTEQFKNSHPVKWVDRIDWTPSAEIPESPDNVDESIRRELQSIGYIQ